MNVPDAVSVKSTHFPHSFLDKGRRLALVNIVELWFLTVKYREINAMFC
jgi:hypothetical protein